VKLSPEGAAASLLWLLPVSMLVAALYALFMGALSLRTQGVYFIMVTLAFSQMAYYVFHDTGIGGGSDGVYLDVKPTLPFVASVNDARTFYYVAAGCLVATFLLLAAIKRARFGHALAGIRINEARMRAAGFSTYAF
jgi:branched-chain amino acid transport system permease protein